VALRWPVVAIVALAVARHDLWWWDDPTRVLGLPIGLAYHVAFCFVIAGVMAWFLRLDPAEHEERPDGDRPS
jgi:hypothetical protein